jgi:eukaryotic-like serine/threonine-protein kinase
LPWPDGKSLITSVGSQDSTVWLHDKDGDHQISSEGNAFGPAFSSDGKSLYFLMANGQTPGLELWVKDLSSGKLEKFLPGYSFDSYAVSRDGKQVAFAMTDQTGRPSMWIAPTNRRSSPVRVSSARIEDSPFFLPDGDIVFRAFEGASNFLYRMKPDGTARRKVTTERILDAAAVSPDGRWLVAGTPGTDSDHPSVVKAFPLNGGEPIPLCLGFCQLTWDASGKFLFSNVRRLHEGTFPLPVLH